MRTTGPAGAESMEGQVTAEDTYAERWVLTYPNDPNPANLMTMALPVASPAATAAAVPQQQQATTGNQGAVNALPTTKFPGNRQAIHIANGGMTEVQWKTVHQWCIVAGQAGGNTKSLLVINVDSVVINDDELIPYLVGT
jgi:hypothetical protein